MRNIKKIATFGTALGVTLSSCQTSSALHLKDFSANEVVAQYNNDYYWIYQNQIGKAIEDGWLRNDESNLMETDLPIVNIVSEMNADGITVYKKSDKKDKEYDILYLRKLNFPNAKAYANRAGYTEMVPELLGDCYKNDDDFCIFPENYNSDNSAPMNNQDEINSKGNDFCILPENQLKEVVTKQEENNKNQDEKTPTIKEVTPTKQMKYNFLYEFFALLFEKIGNFLYSKKWF